MANHKAIVAIDGCESPFLDVLRTMDPRIRNLMLKLEWESEQAFVDFMSNPTTTTGDMDNLLSTRKIYTTKSNGLLKLTRERDSS